VTGKGLFPKLGALASGLSPKGCKLCGVWRRWHLAVLNHVAGNVFFGRGLDLAAVNSRTASIDLFQFHARHCVVFLPMTAMGSAAGCHLSCAAELNAAKENTFAYDANQDVSWPPVTTSLACAVAIASAASSASRMV
jgi:hypothetical protein